VRSFFTEALKDSLFVTPFYFGTFASSIQRLTHFCFIQIFYSEIGAHILSGNVFDPKALEELFPDQADATSDQHWAKELHEVQGSMATPVSKDEFKILTATGSYTVPHIFLPPQLNNDGNYIVSLSQLCRWMAGKAEELGVEIYPGFAASEVLVDDSGACRGIATRDVGIGKDGNRKPTFERGVELVARQTLFAEGARGSCTEWLTDNYKLRDGKQPQAFGLGLKEVWEVPEEVFQAGYACHTLGFPLQSSPMDKVFGGSFLYHQEPNLVLIGLVVGLDYANPYINPYQEFQKWKTHPETSKHLKGGTCVSYGARVLNEGGYHSIPKLTFPGGALLGCGAGFLNAVKIKGSHTALKSGMLAAEAAFDALADTEDSVALTGELPPDEKSVELTGYQEAIDSSWIAKELYEVRNTHEAFSRWGVGGGLVYTGIAAHITKGREPWTLEHKITDSQTTGKAADFKQIVYPPADGTLTFDLLTNLQRAGTYHEDDQPSHLRIKPLLGDIPKSVSLQVHGGPEQRFCPAGVYEYVDNDEAGGPDKKLIINAQNCIHCKCCAIKMPMDYIHWTVPEGGGGPQYQVM
jgi:electron-transferring-flavoprotein dehydrogenase